MRHIQVHRRARALHRLTQALLLQQRTNDDNTQAHVLSINTNTLHNYILPLVSQLVNCVLIEINTQLNNKSVDWIAGGSE